MQKTANTVSKLEQAIDDGYTCMSLVGVALVAAEALTEDLAGCKTVQAAADIKNTLDVIDGLVTKMHEGLEGADMAARRTETATMQAAE